MGYLKKKQKGYTLIEVLVSTTIFIIVLFAIYLMYETNQATYAKGEEKADIQQNARVALDIMEKELKSAGYNPSGVTTTAIQDTSLSSYEITFITDVDADGVTEKVKYTREKPTGEPYYNIYKEVWKWSAGSWGTSTKFPIAEKITDLTFSYYNENNGSTTDPTAVRRITISITASNDVPGQGTQSITLTSDIKLRNM